MAWSVSEKNQSFRKVGRADGGNESSGSLWEEGRLSDL